MCYITQMKQFRAIFPDDLHTWFKKYSKNYGGMTAYIIQHLNQKRKEDREEQLRILRIEEELNKQKKLSWSSNGDLVLGHLIAAIDL